MQRSFLEAARMVTHPRWLCHLHVSNLRLVSVDWERQQEGGVCGLIPH
jgi:hypothetical protein